MTETGEIPPASHIARFKPEPVPKVNPTPEYLVEGRRRAWYEDMKTSLQVPWMGVVTMAFSHYPKFFDTVWTGLKPVCTSTEFVACSARLREFIESRVPVLEPPSIRARLTALGYAPKELQNISNMIDVLTHGNFAYLPFVALCRALLEDTEFGEGREGGQEVSPHKGWHALEHAGPFVLMEAHHGTPEVQTLYADIRQTLGLPFVNTDYRALCRWPSYFTPAWADLKPHIATATYAELTQAMHDQLFHEALNLPNPRGLTSAMVKQAAEQDAPAGEVLSVVRLFAWLLPGLMANVAFFRAQLLEDQAPTDFQ
jgi:hypothetical protein